MKADGRGTSGGGGMILSSGLVVAQLALSLVLIVAAGLLIRTFERLARLPLGFDSERVLIVYTDMTHVQVDPANRVPFYEQIVRAVAAVPGVEQAAISMVTPVSGLSMTDVVNVSDASEMSERDRTVLVNYITPGWFAAYGIPSVLAATSTRGIRRAPHRCSSSTRRSRASFFLHATRSTGRSPTHLRNGTRRRFERPSSA